MARAINFGVAVKRATSGEQRAWQRGHGGRWRVAGLLAATTIGLGLLVAVALGQARQVGPGAGTQGAYPYVIHGSQQFVVPDRPANATSDYGTAFDPYVLQGSQPMLPAYPYVITAPAQPAAAASTTAATSDLGTAFDPYIIQGGQRAMPVYPYVIVGVQRPYVPDPTANATSDYGTAFDPYVLQGSQPLYRGHESQP